MAFHLQPAESKSCLYCRAYSVTHSYFLNN